ncbi:MAG: NAD(P)/FAD-dependent oxidoreductase [Tsuneonella sp.]
MIDKLDILIVGGGVAGLSCGAALARKASVVVLEREEAIGYHSSGRSATWMHLGIGTAAMRALTAASQDFFYQAPAWPDQVPLSIPHPALFVARQDELGQLGELERAMRGLSDRVRRVEADSLRAMVPVLRTGDGQFVAGVCDDGAHRIDSHALLQHHQRTIIQRGGQVETGVRIRSIARSEGRWIVDTPSRSWSADIIVNAAGAWADEVATMAGARPLGLVPRRRTIIGFAAPDGMDVAAWPFLKTVVDKGFYMLPESGRLLASPMDETPTVPTDAQAEEIDIATAAWRVEEATTLRISQITARWAGLRSFLPDGNPAIGYDRAAERFFWLAGQGGAGLQTSPAIAEAAAALILHEPWPQRLAKAGVDAAAFSPTRF